MPSRSTGHTVTARPISGSSRGGLTAGKDLYCHQQAILIHAQVFPQMRTSLAVNPWDLVDPNDTTDSVRMSWTETFDFLEGSGSSTYLFTWDGQATTTLWNGARARLGNRLTLQNNGLGEDEGCFLTGGDTFDNAKKNHICYLSTSPGPRPTAWGSRPRR